ncbi:MAG: methyltransferase [Clostridia bacterium]|nr:methyltransferase [Clostridia bacterium]
MERTDYVNDNLSLIQNTEGLTFGTDALLLSAYVNTRSSFGLELGGGSGIISMLLLTRGKLARADSLEVQAEYASLTERNALLNGLSDRLRSICADAREYKGEREYDVVYTNPPYMTVTGGKMNLDDKKSYARHEHHGTVYDFLLSAKRNLKFGGSFYAVYRPDRLIDLTSAMRQAEIEPKRMTFVHANTESEPSMVLVFGKRGGKSGLILTRPLIIYRDRTNQEYSDDMNYIMNEGSFPSAFIR